MTMVDRHRGFEATWPAVEAHLRRVLAARKVPARDWDDYLQEVAARALASDVPLDSADDILRWSSTVLRNLHLDSLRSGARVQVTPDDQASLRTAAGDVASQVAARMDLAVVAKELSSWSPDQRRLLLSDETTGVRQPSAYYVRRHRLRLRLLAAIDGMAAFWTGVWRRIDPADGDRATAAAVLLPPAALACVVSLVLLDGSGNDGSHPPAAPATTVTAGQPRMVDAPIAAAAFRVATASAGRDAATDGAGVPTVTSSLPSRPPQLAPPVEERVEIGNSGVEVDNDHGKEPLFCLQQAVVVSGVCVDPLPPVDG